VKVGTFIDPAIYAGIREVAKRKKARVCDVAELAFQRYLQEDTANRTDALMAPVIDRVIETRLKRLEGGLRTMIARLAYENLTLQYILCNFLVEASIPAAKVEKWRQDGRKFANQEYRRQRPEFEAPPEDDEA
jgi:hypothetical protein